MSLDDDQIPWPAAEAMERGHNPEREQTAQFRLASLLAQTDDLHTIHHQMLVAGRVLAFLPRIQSWADEEKPKVRKQLRQQQVNETESETFFLEQAHYHLGGYRDAMAALAAMGSVYAKDYQPDEREQDREDDRARSDRQDERAREQAPKVAS